MTKLERHCKATREWRYMHPEFQVRANELQRQYRIRLADRVISHYGSCCNLCGCSKRDLLTIDHINNDGAKHRKSLGHPDKVYRDIIKNEYPNIYRILCISCNWLLGIKGYTDAEVKDYTANNGPLEG